MNKLLSAVALSFLCLQKGQAQEVLKTGHVASFTPAVSAGEVFTDGKKEDPLGTNHTDDKCQKSEECTNYPYFDCVDSYCEHKAVFP